MHLPLLNHDGETGAEQASQEKLGGAAEQEPDHQRDFPERDGIGVPTESEVHHEELGCDETRGQRKPVHVALGGQPLEVPDPRQINDEGTYEERSAEEGNPHGWVAERPGKAWPSATMGLHGEVSRRQVGSLPSPAAKNLYLTIRLIGR